MRIGHRRLALAALVCGACAVPPLADLDAAWRAYQNASSSGAAERSPEQMRDASSALVRGQDALDKGDYEKAAEELRSARRLAEAAGGPSAGAPREPAFTEQPPSNAGVELSPLVPGRGAPPAPSEPPAAPAPPAKLEPAIPPAPAPVPPGAASAAPRKTPEEVAHAIRAERERLLQGEEETTAAASPTTPPREAPGTPDSEAAPEPEPEPERTASAAEHPRTHLVRRGETLYEIARQEYRDEKAWRLIYDANRDQLPNPSDVRAGMSLELPAPGSAPSAASATSRDAAGSYTVRSGENLRTIATKIYGYPGYWKLIYDANRAQLSDPDDVRPGTKLVLPPKPTSR